MSTRKPCRCARCRGLKTADPKYGFDRAAVPAARCFWCDEPIGRRKYRVITMLARFGQMFVAHAGCSASTAP